MIKKRLLLLLVVSLLTVFCCGVSAADADTGFTDMDNHWSQEAVTSIASYGIVTGYSDNTFRPENAVTRAEFAVMVDRLMEADVVGKATTSAEEDSPFVDVPKTHWAYDSIKKLYDLDIIHGVTETSGAHSVMP